jgi:hypothetical protein
MKAGLIGAASAALVLAGCYYPGPYTYYPTVPAQAAGVETIPPNSPDYPQPGSAQNAPPSAQQNAPQSPQSQPQTPPPNGYNGGTVYSGAPGYTCYPGYPCYPAYGYPAYPAYPTYTAYPVYGAPAIGLGFSFGGRWR